jgi:hypothetical protein
MPLYLSVFSIVSNDTTSFAGTGDAFRIGSADLPAGHSFEGVLAEDTIIDKIKGFLYGYIIGSNRANDDRDYLELIKLRNRLNNSLSAEINQMGKHHSSSGDESSLETLREINRICFKRYKANHLSACASSISQALTGSIPDPKARHNEVQLIAEYILEFLKEEQLYDYWESHCTSDSESKIFQVRTVFELQHYIASVSRRIESLFPVSKISEDCFPVIGKRQTVRFSCDNTDSSYLFDFLLQQPDLAETIGSSRYEFVLIVGKAIRAHIEQSDEDWAGSESRRYINGLIKNLNEQDSFDISATDNFLLKSLAAFCKAGKRDDLDSFYDYLVANGIGDVRIAFALWGIVFGFAAMPKTITNELFGSGDGDYINKVYKHVYKQVFETDLRGELSGTTMPISEQKRKDIGISVSQQVCNAVEPDKLHSGYSNNNEDVTPNSKLSEFAQTLRGHKKELREEMKSKTKQEQDKIMRTIDEALEASDMQGFFGQLVEGRVTKRTKLYKYIEKLAKTTSEPAQSPLPGMN